MAKIDLDKTLAAQIDEVFELLSDHAGYTRFSGFSKAELLREGTDEPNGLGAMRRLSARGLTFDEEITAFERPTRMDYLIHKATVPMRHNGGSIRLEPAGEGTRVRWTSEFTMPIPLAGGVLAGAFAFGLERGFVQLLDEIEKHATGRA